MVDTEAAEASILAVVGEAEEAAGETLREIAVTWAGGRPSAGLVTIECEIGGRVIDDDDIDRCLEKVRTAVFGGEREILHILPVEMRPDGGEALADPRGLAAQSLEFTGLVVSVARPALKNLIACLERCHLDVMEVMSATYAAGIGCLTVDELRRGVLLLDLGGGTTSVALFSGGALCHLAQVPYGGEHVTRDLAYCLSTSRAFAERLKNLYGGVLCRACDDNVRIEVPVTGDHAEQPTGEVPRTRLTQIIRARVEETLEMVRKSLHDEWDLVQAKPPRCLVLTGGAAQIEGLEELAEELFGLKSRIGWPAALQSDVCHVNDPVWSTSGGGAILSTIAPRRLKGTFRMDDLEWWIAVSEIARNMGIVVAGGIGIGLAAMRVVAANRQARAATEQSIMARRDHVAELFNRAVGQLADERMEVRLGAVYTLRQIATDFPDLTRDVFELLAAYVRSREATVGESEPPPDIKTIMAMVAKHLGERR